MLSCFFNHNILDHTPVLNLRRPIEGLCSETTSLKNGLNDCPAEIKEALVT